jgi:hypothetical protein
MIVCRRLVGYWSSVVLLGAVPLHPASAADAVTPIVYQDQLLDATEEPVAVEPTATDHGLPRQWMAELQFVQQDSSIATTQTDLNLSVAGNLQTLNWGNWAVDATASQSTDQTAWSGTLWQRQFWLNNQWRLNQSFGVSYTPMPSLFRQASRFNLPSHPMLGWAVDGTYIPQQRPSQTWQMSLGQTGQFTGGKTKNFQSDQGQLFQLATQQQLTPNWNMATTLLSTRCDCWMDTDAIGTALAWQTPQQRAQLNMLYQHNPLYPAFGTWLDGAWQQGRYEHQYGAFWLQPDLAWGDAPVSQDAWGNYYRLNYQFARWLWSLNLDHVYSVSGRSFTGEYLSINARYQALRQRVYGTHLALRRDANDLAVDSQTFVEHLNRMGIQRWQWDYRWQPDLTLMQLNIDQTAELYTGQRISFTGSAFHEQHQLKTDTVGMSAGIYGNVPLNNAWSIDGNARLSMMRQTNKHSVLQDFNMTLNWRPSTAWEWTLRFYKSQSRQQLQGLDPLAPPSLSAVQQQDHQTVLLTLRHQQQTGRHYPIVGGRTGDPYGRIQGEVFLDANQDGIRNANEEAASDITVMLDGRFVKRTDEMGRFVFDFVKIGTHQLSVNADELPLPWQISEQHSTQSVNAQVRQTTYVSVGAIQP